MGIVVLAAILGLIPSIIAERRGHNAFLWWILGAIFFIVALPASLTLSPTKESIEKRKREEGRIACPHCAEYILSAAKICPFCRQPAHAEITKT